MDSLVLDDDVYAYEKKMTMCCRIVIYSSGLEHYSLDLSLAKSATLLARAELGKQTKSRVLSYKFKL